MREYTMNDMAFVPEPLTLFEPDSEYKPDEEELEQGFRKNRELIKEMQSAFPLYRLLSWLQIKAMSIIYVEMMIMITMVQGYFLKNVQKIRMKIQVRKIFMRQD